MSKSKDRNAQALNKKRNAALSSKRRAQIARHAAKARWKDHVKRTIPMPGNEGV